MLLLQQLLLLLLLLRLLSHLFPFAAARAEANAAAELETQVLAHRLRTHLAACGHCKLTWLVLGGDPAARSHRVEQFTAL